MQVHGRLPPGAHAAAAQRAYMHAIRRLHAIRDLEHKHLAVATSWKTEALQWTVACLHRAAQACTLWRGAIHGVEARHGGLAHALRLSHIDDTGSQVAQSFYLLRACWLLNAVLAALWLALVVVPTAVQPPESTSWRMFLSRRAWAKMWQGDGLETSLMLHGVFVCTAVFTTILCVFVGCTTFPQQVATEAPDPRSHPRSPFCTGSRL